MWRRPSPLCRSAGGQTALPGLAIPLSSRPRSRAPRGGTVVAARVRGDMGVSDGGPVVRLGREVISRPVQRSGGHAAEHGAPPASRPIRGRSRPLSSAVPPPGAVGAAGAPSESSNGWPIQISRGSMMIVPVEPRATTRRNVVTVRGWTSEQPPAIRRPPDPSGADAPLAAATLFERCCPGAHQARRAAPTVRASACACSCACARAGERGDDLNLPRAASNPAAASSRCLTQQLSPAHTRRHPPMCRRSLCCFWNFLFCNFLLFHAFAAPAALDRGLVGSEDFSDSRLRARTTWLQELFLRFGAHCLALGAPYCSSAHVVGAAQALKATLCRS